MHLTRKLSLLVVCLGLLYAAEASAQTGGTDIRIDPGLAPRLMTAVLVLLLLSPALASAKVRDILFFKPLDWYLESLVACIPASKSFRTNPLPLHFRLLVTAAVASCVIYLLDYLLSGDPIHSCSLVDSCLRYHRAYPHLTEVLAPRFCVMILKSTFCLVGLIAFPALTRRNRGAYLISLGTIAATAGYNVLILTSPALQERLDYFPDAPSQAAVYVRPAFVALICVVAGLLLLKCRMCFFDADWSELQPCHKPTAKDRRCYRRAALRTFILLPVLWLGNIVVAHFIATPLLRFAPATTPTLRTYVLRWNPGVLDPQYSCFGSRHMWSYLDAVAGTESTANLNIVYGRHARRFRCIDTLDECYGHAIRAAVQNGREANIRFLLSRPKISEHRLSGVWVAFQSHQPWLAPMLIEGVDPNQADGRGGMTPLMRAAASGNVAAIEFYLLHGAAVNQTTGDGRNALWFARANEKPEAVQVLIAHGAVRKLPPGKNQAQATAVPATTAPGGTP